MGVIQPLKRFIAFLKMVAPMKFAERKLPKSKSSLMTESNNTARIVAIITRGKMILAGIINYQFYKNMKTLEEFLIKNRACEDGFDFAKDLTLEEFLNTCRRGDWILWLFARTNPDSLRELTLAKGHCANTVRGEMHDERSTNAVDVAIAFGEGKATREELDDAAAAAAAAAVAWDAAAAYAAAYAAGAAYAAAAAAYAAYAAAYARAAAYAAGDAAAKKENQKLTADICRTYLRLEIWDQLSI